MIFTNLLEKDFLVVSILWDFERSCFVASKMLHFNGGAAVRWTFLELCDVSCPLLRGRLINPAKIRTWIGHQHLLSLKAQVWSSKCSLCLFCTSEQIGEPTWGLTTFSESQEFTTFSTDAGEPMSSSHPHSLTALLTLSDFGASTTCASRSSEMFESLPGRFTFWCLAEASENTLPHSPFGFSVWEVTAHTAMFTKGGLSARATPVLTWELCRYVNDFFKIIKFANKWYHWIWNKKTNSATQWSFRYVKSNTSYIRFYFQKHSVFLTDASIDFNGVSRFEMVSLERGGAQEHMT